MEDIFVIIFIILIYVFACWITNLLIRNKYGRNHFWVLFWFSPIFGVILAIILDYRDIALEKHILETTNVEK